MATRGVWGEQMRIIVPVLYKRVTCATCIYYCHEDHSCMVSPIIPKVDGFDYWKKCKSFELSSEYFDDSHKMQVIRIKGEHFFKKDRRIVEQKVINKGHESIGSDKLCIANQTKLKNENKAKTFSEQFLEVVKIKHGVTFGEIALPELPGLNGVKCYVNLTEKLIVMTMPQIKNKKIQAHHNMNRNVILADLWMRFSESLKGIVEILSDLDNSDEFEKWIVIPVYKYKEEESCGEVFYKTRGRELKGIRLVEMDENGDLLFATGPIFEKYWTAEKIKNLQIFKK